MSLGPGDPGLITLKGWQVLQRADKIYYPGSLLPGGGTKSYALSILQQLDLQEKHYCPVLLSMDAERSHNLGAYETAFKQIQADYENGLQVAYVSEGDSTFYSTFAYILQHINAAQLPVEIILNLSAASSKDESRISSINP